MCGAEKASDPTLPVLQWAEHILEYISAYRRWPIMSLWHPKKCMSWLLCYGCRLNVLHTNTCWLFYQLLIVIPTWITLEWMNQVFWALIYMNLKWPTYHKGTFLKQICIFEALAAINARKFYLGDLFLEGWLCVVKYIITKPSFRKPGKGCTDYHNLLYSVQP